MPSVPQSGEEDMEQEAGGDRGQEGGVEGQAARVEEEEVAGGEQEGWMREEQEAWMREEQEGGEEDEMGEEEEAGDSSSSSNKKLSKKKRMAMEKEKRQECFRAAAAGWGTGQFPSLSACAKSFGVDVSILHRGIVETGGLFPGRGKFSTILQKNEEEMVKNHVRLMATIGYGVTLEGMRCLLQEVLLSLVAANPSRKTGLEDRNQLPHPSYVQRFVKRNGLSLRKTSQISKGRAVISPADIRLWFKDISSFLDGPPDLLAALQDPRRVFNQDETACELGVG